MKFTKNIGMLLLAAWLILSGLVALFEAEFCVPPCDYGHPRPRRRHLHLAGR